MQEMPERLNPDKKRVKRRMLICGCVLAVLIPLTIAGGVFLLNDRQYYVISLLLIGYIMVPFFLSFEGRRPHARELVLLAAMVAIGVAGRAAFFMLPQFKPVAAVVIITAICFGPECGFLTGALITFVSNMYVGQGPWTPWQMVGFGLIGFLSGILFRRTRIEKHLGLVCIFGFLAVMLIFGPIADLCSVMMSTAQLSWALVGTTYLMGIPFNLVHAAATVFFLAVAARPLLEKLERIKVKYGLFQR